MSTKKFNVSMSEDSKRMTVIDLSLNVSHTFELVDRVTLGYQIWNIGKNMPDGYLPLCRLKPNQPFPGGRSIEPDTLRAIKCEGAQKILAAVRSGAETVREMEQYVAEHQNAEEGTWECSMVEKIKEALPYMRQIKGLEA